MKRVAKMLSPSMARMIKKFIKNSNDFHTLYSSTLQLLRGCVKIIQASLAVKCFSKFLTVCLRRGALPEFSQLSSGVNSTKESKTQFF